MYIIAAGAQQTGRGVGLDGVDALGELLGSEVDAYLHLGALVIYLTRLGVDELLAVHLEDTLLVGSHQDAVRSLDADVHAHGAFGSDGVLNQREAGAELLDAAAAVGLLVGGVDTDDVDAAALDLGALLHELGVLVGGLAQFLVALG